MQCSFQFFLRLPGIGIAHSHVMADLLVVDDDVDVAMPLITILEMEGHQVRYARDGEVALLKISERFPDLVLLDIEMPRLSGTKVAYRMLIEDCGRENIPIFVLSGVTDLSAVVRKIGTPYFLSKPYLLDEMLAILNKALSDRVRPNPLVSP